MFSKIAKIAAIPFRAFSIEAEGKALDLIEELYVSLVHHVGVRISKKYSTSRELNLNVGSGPYPKNGFLNLDFSPQADLRLDLRQPIPLPEASCQLIFTEHFVEHLSYPEGVDRFFTNAHRILQPSGRILISVPETKWLLEEYIAGGSKYIEQCKKSNWHPEDLVTFMEHINYHFRQRCVGRRESHFECHRFAYDFETMKVTLERNGFSGVRLRDFDPVLDSEHRRVGSLFVEAVKPVA